MKDTNEKQDNLGYKITGNMGWENYKIQIIS